MTIPSPHTLFAVGRWSVRWYDQVGSTNDVARDRAADGNVFDAIVADMQTAGRGQYGRQWQAPAGENLLATFVLPVGEAKAPALTSLAASLAVCDTLAAHGVDTVTKWPNDTMADGAKIAGILVERDAGTFCIGVGMNVNWPRTRLAQEDGSAWTSVWAETGQRGERDGILRTLCIALDRRCCQPAACVLDAYRQRWTQQGSRAHVLMGNKWMPGIIGDIAPDGSLCVAMGNNEPASVRSSAQIRCLNEQE